MRPPIEILIARAYGRAYPWMAKVNRLPGSGLLSVWRVGEHVPANDEHFDSVGDSQAVTAPDGQAE